jgi:hypothetical protein
MTKDRESGLIEFNQPTGRDVAAVAPAVVAEWSPPSWATMLRDVAPDSLLNRLYDSVDPEPDDDETSSVEHSAWSVAMDSALKTAITPEMRAGMAPHAGALARFCEQVKRWTHANYDDIEARKKRFVANNFWKPAFWTKLRATAWYEWAKQKYCDDHYDDGCLIHVYARALFKQQCDATQRDIDAGISALVTGGADPEIVIYDVARAVAEGRGHGDYLAEIRDLTFGLRNKKRDEGPVVADFIINDFDRMAEFVLRVRPEISDLALGAFSKKFYVNGAEIPTPVLNHIIREVMTKSAVIKDPWKENEFGQDGKRIVKLTSTIVREIRESLAERRVVDDRGFNVQKRGPVDTKAVGGTTLDLIATRIDTSLPPFDDVLVLDPGAWTASIDIRRVLDAPWQDWCQRMGRDPADDRPLFAALKAWGGASVARKQRRSGGVKVWGYQGLRVRP